MTNKPVSAGELIDRLDVSNNQTVDPLSVTEAKRHLAEAINWMIYPPQLLATAKDAKELRVMEKLIVEQRKRLAEWLGESDVKL